MDCVIALRASQLMCVQMGVEKQAFGTRVLVGRRRAISRRGSFGRSTVAGFRSTSVCRDRSEITDDGERAPAAPGKKETDQRPVANSNQRRP